MFRSVCKWKFIFLPRVLWEREKFFFPRELRESFSCERVRGFSRESKLSWENVGKQRKLQKLNDILLRMWVDCLRYVNLMMDVRYWPDCVPTQPKGRCCHLKKYKNFLRTGRLAVLCVIPGIPITVKLILKSHRMKQNKKAFAKLLRSETTFVILWALK